MPVDFSNFKTDKDNSFKLTVNRLLLKKEDSGDYPITILLSSEGTFKESTHKLILKIKVHEEKKVIIYKEEEFIERKKIVYAQDG